MTSIHADPLSPSQDLGRLTVAFQTFNQTSRRLEEAYRLLQERVRAIDRQLLEANERLNRKVEELHSLTSYLNEILASMHNGVAAIDLEGRITTFNAAAERALGVSAAEVLGRPHESVLCSADGSPSPLAGVLATGRRDNATVGSPTVATAGTSLAGPASRGTLHVEREVVSRSGRCLRLRSSVAPIRDSRGLVVGAVEIFSDLTEFRQLQERLDRADKLAALGAMAAQVAHEIRNPLNGIEGFASLLLRDLPAEDARRAFAQHVLAGAQSLNKIVNNMLLFCQPCTLQPRPTWLRQVVEDALVFVVEDCRRHESATKVPRLAGPARLVPAVATVGEPTVALSLPSRGHPPAGGPQRAACRGESRIRPSSGEHKVRPYHGLQVRRDYDPAAEPIEADADQLYQVFLNLLLNAVQAMGYAGDLRLSTRSLPGSPERVEARIQDSGPGVPQELRARVMDPFFTTKSQGTGLGLAIVQKIVRLHGGEFELESPAGGGAIAVVTLPRCLPRVPNHAGG
jgi:signal transduction histidine kinase